MVTYENREEKNNFYTIKEIYKITKLYEKSLNKSGKAKYKKNKKVEASRETGDF